MPEPLSELERGILDYLVDYLRDNTYQPSIREVGRRFNIKSTKTVSEHLQSLADKGWIERDPSRSRGVRILGLDLGAGATETLNAVPSGTHMLVPESLAGGRQDDVRVTTAGPAEAGLRAGDTVLLEAVDDEKLSSGDLVAARLNSEIAVGICRQDGSGLVLDWGGAVTLPLRPQRARGLEILGRAIGFCRELRGSRRSNPSSPIPGRPA